MTFYTYLCLFFIVKAIVASLNCGFRLAFPSFRQIANEIDPRPANMDKSPYLFRYPR